MPDKCFVKFQSRFTLHKTFLKLFQLLKALQGSPSSSVDDTYSDAADPLHDTEVLDELLYKQPVRVSAISRHHHKCGFDDQCEVEKKRARLGDWLRLEDDLNETSCRIVTRGFNSTRPLYQRRDRASRVEQGGGSVTTAAG